MTFICESVDPRFAVAHHLPTGFNPAMPNFERFVIAITALLIVTSMTSAADLGVFNRQGDIGVVRHAGSSKQVREGTFSVSGSGDNMWSTNDAFHFVWKKLTGDVSLTADIAFVTEGGNAHRKACLLIRQDLDPDSAYADAALHGNGLTALQYRETKGGRTADTPSKISAPKRLRIEKRGDEISLGVAAANEELHPAGSVHLKLKDPFFVGLGVCSHDSNAVVTATFSNVELRQLTTSR
jgi:TolB protein